MMKYQNTRCYNEVIVLQNKQINIPRTIDTYTQNISGPCVICVGAMHGNEPTGVHAIKRVFARLQSEQPNFRGQFIGLHGNRTAFQKHVRQIDRDLNRVWKQERTARLIEQVRIDSSVSSIFDNTSYSENLSVEDVEQIELLRTLLNIFEHATGEIYLLDLHTTSSKSAPFLVMGDTLRNRKFAKYFPAPVLLGLEEQLEGSLTEWVNSQGHIAIAFEAGQHKAAESIDIHESAIWIALAASGCIQRGEVPVVQHAPMTIASKTSGLPKFMEVRIRHHVLPKHQFAMKPGYKNFQRVQKGELLACNRKGNIYAQETGRILMPLYQTIGDDGFFIAREIREVWLTLSAFLRRLRVDRIAPFLPGVNHHTTRKDTLIINRHLARWAVFEVFHLLGYRKRREGGDHPVVSRRPYDLQGPPRNPKT